MIWKNPDGCETVRKMGIDLEKSGHFIMFSDTRTKNFRVAMLPMFLALWCKAAFTILAMFNMGMIFCLCCIDVTLLLSVV